MPSVTIFDFTYFLCIIDDFFQKFEASYWEFLKYSNKRMRMRSSQLKISENVFIAIGINAPISITSNHSSFH